jgi:predicted ester cyclase
MSIAANKAVVQRFAEQMLSQHQLGVAADLFTPDFVDHDADDPDGRVSGVDGAMAEVGVYVTAFPDMRVDIDALLAEGDLVFMRARLRGTHRGELPGGLAATGQPVDVWAWQTFRLVDGKIAEAWLNIDRLRLMQQLGALPLPA